MKCKILISLILILFLISSCTKEYEIIDRNAKIPTDIQKITPEIDIYPPILHSDEFEKPIPLAIINTAGGEDSPFIPEDSNDLYFFFTPDVRVPIEKQILDGVTGIWYSKNINGVYQEPERVFLQDPKKLSLDGCEFIKQNEMLFCTAREGYTGLHWFKAEYKEGKWTNWKNADFNPNYDVGELHIYQDELYYHSSKSGGKGGLDIWVSKKINNEWQQPENVEIVNTKDNEGWPYISQDGSELWINRWYMGSPALFRSKKINNEWQEPELIISQFAGEPTLDQEGNLYFVHHYYKNSVMLEADIYVAYKK